MSPDFDSRLEKYARLIIRSGCNLRKGQELLIEADASNVDLVRKLVKEAYEQGASDVTVRLTDEICGRMGYDYRSVEDFSKFPDWLALLHNGIAKRGAALLFITSEDPQSMTGVDPRKLAARIKASHEACRDWRNGMDFGHNVWCIVGAASPAWASRVFPDLSEDEAMSRLWDAIFSTVRVDTPDPIAAWEAHKESFAARKKWLNDQGFDALHYTSSLGTDITVGLTPKSIWEGGGATTVDGTYFFPNMPTEEVFSSPDRNRCDGIVYSSLPLNHDGALIEDFSITFKGGRVVDFHAEKGEDALRGIIETDEGSHHLGEVALIPCSSPIRKTGILFLNTLFDENASCHMALGMGFPDCYEGGLEMNTESLLAAGINESATHVDFMLGTDDLSIDGVLPDGHEVPVFRNGTWAS